MSVAVLVLLIGFILMCVSGVLDLVAGGVSSALYKFAWACFLLWLVLGAGHLAIQ